MQEQQAWTSLSILIRAPIKASQDEGCKKNVDQSWIYRAHLKMRRCESDSISMLRWSMFSSRRRRVGWFKCSCGGGRDQSRGHPMRFCFGTPGKSGGCAVRITGGAARVAPQGSRSRALLLCRGQTALHSSSSGDGREGDEGRAEIEQGCGEHLAYSPFNLGNTLFLSVSAWNTPNIRRWKQDRLNKNNNNS